MSESENQIIEAIRKVEEQLHDLQSEYDECFDDQRETELEGEINDLESQLSELNDKMDNLEP